MSSHQTKPATTPAKAAATAASSGTPAKPKPAASSTSTPTKAPGSPRAVARTSSIGKIFGFGSPDKDELPWQQRAHKAEKVAGELTTEVAEMLKQKDDFAKQKQDMEKEIAKIQGDMKTHMVECTQQKAKLQEEVILLKSQLQAGEAKLAKEHEGLETEKVALLAKIRDKESEIQKASLSNALQLENLKGQLQRAADEAARIRENEQKLSSELETLKATSARDKEQTEVGEGQLAKERDTLSEGNSVLSQKLKEKEDELTKVTMDCAMQIENLKGQLQRTVQEYSQERENAHALVVEVETLKDQVSHATEEATRERENGEKLSTEMATLKEQLQRITQEHTDCAQEKSKLRVEIASLKAQLEEALDKAREQTEVLTRELSTLKANLAAGEGKLAQVNAELAQKLKDKEEEFSKASFTAALQIENLKGQLQHATDAHALEKENAHKFAVEAETLKDQASRATQEAEQERGNAKKLATEIDALKGQLLRTSQDHTLEKANSQRYTSDLAKLKEQLEQATQARARAMEEAQTEISKLKDQIEKEKETVQTRVKDAQSEKAKLAASVEQEKTKLAEENVLLKMRMQSQVEQKEKEIAKMLEENNCLKQQLQVNRDIQQKLLEQHSQDTATLKSEQQEGEGKLSAENEALKSKNESLAQQLVVKDEELEKLSKTNAVLIEDLKGQLLRTTEEHLLVKDNAQKLTVEVETLKVSLATEEASHARDNSLQITNEIQSLKGQLFTATQEHMRETELAQKEIAKLKEQHTHDEEIEQKLQKEMETLKEQCERYRDTAAKAAPAEATTTKMIAENANLKMELHAKFQEKENVVAKALEESNGLKQQIKKLTEQHEKASQQLKSSLQETEREKEKTLEELKILQLQLQEAESKKVNEKLAEDNNLRKELQKTMEQWAREKASSDKLAKENSALKAQLQKHEDHAHTEEKPPASPQPHAQLASPAVPLPHAAAVTHPQPAKAAKAVTPSAVSPVRPPSPARPQSTPAQPLSPAGTQSPARTQSPAKWNPLFDFDNTLAKKDHEGDPFRVKVPTAVAPQSEVLALLGSPSSSAPAPLPLQMGAALQPTTVAGFSPMKPKGNYNVDLLGSPTRPMPSQQPQVVYPAAMAMGMGVGMGVPVGISYGGAMPGMGFSSLTPAQPTFGSQPATGGSGTSLL
eukprot:TRINITY_DN1107_c0_g1_i3.p1 TRINITY_DN1107_c0_g1~~TRINITY_DN1107_c0_g1_i3.p1  ORF type:complete len:1163 (-),score=390.19 TRINITY_DN1107_c0_g1_i3:47-3535(-)